MVTTVTSPAFNIAVRKFSPSGAVSISFDNGVTWIQLSAGQAKWLAREIEELAK